MQNAYEINKLGALYSALHQCMMKAFLGQSDSSAAILLTLRHWQPLTVNDLSAIVGLSQPACSRALDKLAAEAWVQRDVYEGKYARLNLTAKGRRQADQMQDARLQQIAPLLDGLTEIEKASLSKLLNKILANAVDDRACARHLCRWCKHDICEGLLCPIGTEASETDGIN